MLNLECDNGIAVMQENECSIFLETRIQVCSHDVYYLLSKILGDKKQWEGENANVADVTNLGIHVLGAQLLIVLFFQLFCRFKIFKIKNFLFWVTHSQMVSGLWSLLISWLSLSSPLPFIPSHTLNLHFLLQPHHCCSSFTQCFSSLLNHGSCSSSHHWGFLSSCANLNYFSFKLISDKTLQGKCLFCTSPRPSRLRAYLHCIVHCAILKRTADVRGSLY